MLKQGRQQAPCQGLSHDEQSARHQVYQPILFWIKNSKQKSSVLRRCSLYRLEEIRGIARSKHAPMICEKGRKGATLTESQQQGGKHSQLNQADFRPYRRISR